jgi:hypothetical protein
MSLPVKHLRQFAQNVALAGTWSYNLADGKRKKANLHSQPGQWFDKDRD